MAISAAEVEVLRSWGLSAQAYAAYMTGTATITVAVYWLLSGLILWRLGTSQIGLSVSLVLVAIPITMIADSSTLVVSYPSLRTPWILLSALGSLFIFLFVFLFPNGRFYPRWAFIPLSGVMLLILISNILEILGFNAVSSFQLPFLLAILAFGVLGCTFQILRYRRVSSPVERQQTKWALLGIIGLIIGIPVWILFFGGVLEISPGVHRLWGSIGGWLTNMFLSLTLPVTIAIAILRYRLWDIDLIIRKTLIYVILTALLVSLYFGTVTLLQYILTSVTGQQSSLAIVVSTLAIAALFNPLRHRIQSLIDRRFYRLKLDARQTLAEFSSTLREEVDLDRLSTALLSTVDSTMQPEHVTLWINEAKRE
jgi:hypothetical protein